MPIHPKHIVQLGYHTVRNRLLPSASVCTEGYFTCFTCWSVGLPFTILFTSTFNLKEAAFTPLYYLKLCMFSLLKLPSIVTQCMSLHSMQCRLVIAHTLATLKYQLHIRNIMKSLVFGCCNHCKHNCGSTCCFSLLLQSGMQAVRENRYIILSKDFEKAYKKAIKKDDQEHDFYK